MNLKEVVIVIVVMILLGFGFNYLDSSRADALVAEEKVRVLEAERVELERETEEALLTYELLQDSLDEAHDSIAEIREGAKNRATESSLAFKENVSILRDSLEGYGGLEAILDTLTASHLREVSAYQDQVATLEADKVLLWKRVEALDSMWIREQEINQALRNEIVALNEESDAWRRVATPDLFKRLSGAVPYLIVGAGVGLLIR
jgi:chromosome segregation ATPase|tara:strand:+ start:324 stop:938 length:615 start_codon:yes stop_codon:yes gene_type:complete